jgi:hypothetical protein
MFIDFGAVAAAPFEWAVMARESRYDHRLFWPSPADTPEVRSAMRMTAQFGIATASWATIWLLVAVFLVSWGSPLVTPVAVGFVALGYLFTLAQAAGVRSKIEKIVRRARDQRLAVLRSRIDAFAPRFADLSPEESERVRNLVDLHDTIRDAPTTPTTSRTLLRAAAPLILPTIMFVITVFGEVSAERFLDRILP